MMRRAIMASANIWRPSELFADGANGLWYRFADIDTLYKDTSMTIPVAVDNDPVGAIVDKSGNGVNGLQSVSAERLAFKTSPYRINFDKVNDNIDIDFGAAFSGTVYINTDDGLLSYETNVPSGVWQLPLDTKYLHSNGFREIIALAGAAKESDYNLVRKYMGAGVFAPVGSIADWFRNRSDIVSFFDYSLDASNGTHFSYTWAGCSSLVNFPLLDVSNGTIFFAAWLGCSSLVNFPSLDTSNGTDFGYAWIYCSSLVSFPLLDVSNGTTFHSTWRECSSLVNFPANFFNNCSATDFINAFVDTNLSQESIDSILVSINSNGTYNGTFNQSGGYAPSATGQAAINAMRSRGWTVTVSSTVPWQPSKFFEGSVNGLWYRFADIDTLYKDTSMTVHVTADNDPVGAIVDKSGNNVNGLQAVSSERVAFKTLPNRINFDKTDDNIDIDFGAAFGGTVYINTDDGLLSYEIDVPDGVWQLPIDARYLHSNGFREIIAVARAANESDYNLVKQYMGAEVFAPVGIIEWWFWLRSDITSFFDYSLDVSSGSNFSYTWNRCSSLVSFPLLDVSNGSNFYAAWYNCSSLFNFPANFFNNCSATNFTLAFANTDLSQESIDGILVSINSNATSNGTFSQSGGNAPSAVGEAAILDMRSRGWTVTVTGGF